MPVSVFNRTIFNDDVFNTAIVNQPGFSNRPFKKEPKRTMYATAGLKVSARLTTPVSLSFESKILTEYVTKTQSKILQGGSIVIISKILCEVHQPVKSVVSRDYSVPIKGRLNSMELSMNKFVKYNKINTVISLLDLYD